MTTHQPATPRRGPSPDQPDALPPTTAPNAPALPAPDRGSGPMPYPANCGHTVDAYPPSYEAWCDVCERQVVVLTALTDHASVLWTLVEDEL